MEYKVRVTETLEKIVTINTLNIKKALEKAQEKYDEGEDDFILTSDNYTGVNFEVIKE